MMDSRELIKIVEIESNKGQQLLQTSLMTDNFFDYE